MKEIELACFTARRLVKLEKGTYYATAGPKSLLPFMIFLSGF
jgi:hypothetical protein